MQLIRLLALVLSIHTCFAEPNTQSLNQFQKQTARSSGDSSGAAIDLMILDLVQGKLKNQDGKGPFWIIPKYPTPAQIAAGAMPRLRVNRAASANQKALVPLRLVRGVIPPGKTCIATTQYRLLTDQACSVLDGVLSCGVGKIPAVGTECAPNGGRGTSILSLDGSGLGSLEESLPDSESQLAFIGLGHLGLMASAPTESAKMFSKSDALMGENFIASVPVKFNKYIPHPTFPSLVQGIQVQAGKTLAVLPIDPPPQPTCNLVMPQQIKATDVLSVTLQASSVLSAASLNGRTLAVSSDQSSNEGLRAISTQAFSIDTKQLKNVVQLQNSDMALGIFSVEGIVFGPKAQEPTKCLGEVAVEFYNPRPPECALSLSPDTQEPDEPVQVTVTAKNQVTSAILNGSIGISFSPTPSASTVGSFSTTLKKVGEAPETISVRLTGPGGQVSCSRQLFPQVPLPPTCSLAANPNQVKKGDSTTLTLTTTNRVDTASIAGRSLALSAHRHGSGSIIYQKASADPEQLVATVGSRWGQSTCSVNLACAPSPAPRCQLSVAPEKMKPGEEGTVTLECQDPVVSASIMGFNVSLSGGRASIRYTKNGPHAENLEAIARGEGQCGTEARPTTPLLAVPPCRFANPDYSETLKVDVWKWNTVYDIFEKTSYTKDREVEDQCTGRGRNRRCTYRTVTDFFPCNCGERVSFNNQGEKICAAGATPLTDPKPHHEAEEYIGARTDLCMKANRSQLANSNEWKFARGTKWNVDFQHKLKRVHELKDKVNNKRVVTTYEVPSNLDFLDPGSAAPLVRSYSFTSEAACSTSCPSLAIDAVDRFWPGDLCVSKEVTGVIRTTGSGRNKRTYLDSDAICESEALIGSTISRTGGVTVKAVPGKYEVNIRATHGPFEGRDLAVEKICADNHLCVLETTPGAARSSPTYFWLEVGPVDDEKCDVTRIDTAVSARTSGCFTGSTPITMANGKEKLISEIRENDYVLNPHYGMGVRVRKVVKGPEKKPLFAVMLGKKRVEVTEDHPFFTQRGWVQTLDLKPGDQLFGKGQGQVITKVMRLPYQQPVDVWNFELDTEDPLAHVVVANGIPTGDLVTQLALKKNKKPLP